jgi:hypothetical protein
MRAIKSIRNQTLLFVAGTMLSLAVPAQTSTVGADSVAFVRVKFTFDKFTFSDGGQREIRIKGNETKIVNDKGKSLKRYLGNGLLTLVTGVGMGSSDSVNLKVAGTVKCNDGLPDWKIALFCKGNEETSRERVKDDDGSISVNTETLYTYYWEKEATGFLTEGDDTVGFFKIVMKPREDTLIKPMADYFFLPVQVEEAKNPDTMTQFMDSSTTLKDYGITGIFRGQSFAIISDGRQNKSWVFYNNTYLFMLHSGNMMNHVSKGVTDPYLLINNNESGPDRRDLFRLAMVCRFLNYSISL